MMSESKANNDMVEGFRDGYDLALPDPGENRSHSYRHGFMCGRFDKGKAKFKGTTDDLRNRANAAMQRDQFYQ